MPYLESKEMINVITILGTGMEDLIILKYLVLITLKYEIMPKHQ